MNWLFDKKEISAVIGTIAIGIIIRSVYDFIIKPVLKKKKDTHTNKQLKNLIKNAKHSQKDFHSLLIILRNSENHIYQDYYNRLKIFDKNRLNEAEENSKIESLKELKHNIK